LEELEQSVWQRVLGERTYQETMGLKALVLEAMEAAAEYRQLQRGSGGKIRELAGKMLENEQRNLASLKGLYALQQGRPMKLQPLPALEKAGRRQLEKRYHRTRREIAEYTARSADAQWGCVFQQMAKEREAQCALLVRLMGYMI